ncbi:MAG: hypothetical protein R3B55_01760 [Candidatus Paceibacterota bacterium]
MEKAIRRIKKNIKNVFIVLLISVFSFPATSLAASLSVLPSSGTYEKGKVFSVSIFVSSPDQAMNAASAVIKFPSDKLQVTSISKAGSIIDFWAQEPSFSNAIGEIKLDGIVLTPGFKGNSGKILTINLKGKNAGPADVKIFSSSVLANNGLGTNILINSASASFNISEVEFKEPEVIKVDDLKPIEPEDTVSEEVCEPDSLITSSTHPGIVWRRENTAAFSWDIKPDTLASKISFDRRPDTEPTNINSPAIVEKRYENLEDGIWYFHLSLQDNSGWSKPEHFKIKIDHTPPEIQANEIRRSDLTDPKPKINIKITDKISCVKNFELSINGEILDYEKISNNEIQLQSIEPGEHELVITAYDRAGNKNETFLDIVVKALEVPVVTSYPAEIKVGEKLEIKGETIPNGNIEARLTSKRNNFLIKEEFQSASGKFKFEQENLKKGTVFVSFRVTDARGARSQWSVPVETKIKSSSILPIDSIVSSLGVEVAVAVGVVLVFIIILATRALTIRKIKRDLGI